MARAGSPRAVPPLKKGEIALVGVGPSRDLRHITREAYDFLAAVSACADPRTRIYTMDAQAAFRHPLLARAVKAGACRDLVRFYEIRWVQPIQAYEAVAQLVLRRARAGFRVVLLCMGNPLIWALPSLLVRRACLKENIPHRVIVSPSFLDLIFEHVDSAAGEGLLLGIAWGVAFDTPPLDPRVPCLLGQLTDSGGVAGDRYVAVGAPALANLQARLLEVYPSDHPAILIHAQDPDARMAARHIRLGELTQHEDVGMWANLWIPPVPRRPT